VQIIRSFVLLCLLGFVLPAYSVLPTFDPQGKELPTLAPLLKEVNPSVVNIATYTTRNFAQNPLLNDPFFRRFFEMPQNERQPQRRRTQSAGSGVIIDAKAGIVITNHHVVEGADDVMVGLSDGRMYKAELLGSDPEVDIAVIKMQEFEDLTELKFGDSDEMEQGDFVMAIGNPFGLGHSVTSGIVSAIGRSGMGIQGYENFIQTDASINPGNSGGALINLRGELIGINTAILAPAGGNVGIGFAIPMNMAKLSIDQILETGEVKRGQLGVYIQDLTRELAQAFELDAQQRGVLIAQVQPGSAADKAGLKEGDIVIEVNEKVVETTSKFRNEIGMRRIGDEIELTILRGGKKKTLDASIGEKVFGVAAVAKDSGAIHPFLDGATIRGNDDGGVVVSEVKPGSAASQSGIREGDVILSANRQRVDTLDQLKRAASMSDERLVLRIRRGNAALYLVLQ